MIQVGKITASLVGTSAFQIPAQGQPCKLLNGRHVTLILPCKTPPLLKVSWPPPAGGTAKGHFHSPGGPSQPLTQPSPPLLWPGLPGQWLPSAHVNYVKAEKKLTAIICVSFCGHSEDSATPREHTAVPHIPECPYARAGQEKHVSNQTPSYFMTPPPWYLSEVNGVQLGAHVIYLTVCILRSTTDIHRENLGNQEMHCKVIHGQI